MNNYEKEKLIELLTKQITFDYTDYFSEDYILKDILKLKYCEKCGKSMNLDDTCQPCSRETKIDEIIG